MDLDDKTKLIIMFLLTNDKIPTLPAYRITKQEISLYCATTPQKVDELLPQLEEYGIYFYEGYVILDNKYTRAKYTGGKTTEARQRTWNNYPPEIRDIVDLEGNIAQSLLNRCSTIGSSNHKPITINHKPIPETRLPNLYEIDSTDIFEEIASKYGVTVEFVSNSYDNLKNYCEQSDKNMKKYTDYIATLRNFVKRDMEKSSSYKKTNARPNIVFVNPE